MNKKWIGLALSAGVISSAMAGTMGPITTEGSHWVAGLNLGVGWNNAGNTQTFFLDPSILKTYAANKSQTALFNGELFLGMQNNLNSSWLTQIGLAYGTAGDAKLQGAIWDDADPAFDNYSYDYNVWHNRVAVKGKLIYDNNYWAAPYASGSAGVAFNRSYSYGNMPRTFNAKPNENFASHSKTAFTYTLGAGLQKSLNDKWQVGLGYEFADWGKSSLGRAFGQTLGSGLQLDHLYTNSVVFNLTYVV